MSGAYPTLKFAIFSVICALIGFWIISMIGNVRVFESDVTYEAVFDDATGLLENDEVKVAGIAVGRVDSVEVERGQAVARFRMRDDIDLGEDTTVGIRWRGLQGLRFLYVYPQGDGQLEEGHRFSSERTFAPASIAVALERITPIMRSLEPEVQNTFLRAMEEALVGRETEIQQLIAEAGSLTQTLADRDTQIGRLLENAATVTGALAQRDDEIRSMLASFANSAELIASRNDQLEALIVQLSDNQSELRRMLDANEADVRGILAELEQITTILSDNRENLEDVLKYSGEGIVFYHRISRWGQFFNVRFVGVTVGEDRETFVSDGRGSEPPEPRRERQDTGGGGTPPQMSSFFGGGMR
jgi:phospholipid/cholesterol/gamma-HCH transport system substrate-binding protein